MSADFLTDAQVKALSARASEVARLHCEARFASLGDGFGSALFNACRESWGTGPSTTSARLCLEASDHIEHTWKHRDHFYGLVIKKTAKDFIPLYLANASLAPALAANGPVWVDFQAVTKELGLLQIWLSFMQIRKSQIGLVSSIALL